MRFALIFAALASFFTPSAPAAQLPTATAAKIDDIAAKTLAESGAPSVSIAVVRGSQIVFEKAYGKARLDPPTDAKSAMRYSIGSVSKQFLAASILLLAQDGKLSLDDDIRKYLPEVPNFGPTITIRNLLTHTSGLRDQWGLLGIEGRGPGTQVHSSATTLDLVAHQKMLNFPPGSEYLYSNTGYALAGVIVERVSGKSLDEFTQERLFRPLGMAHTQWRDDFTKIVPNRAPRAASSSAPAPPATPPPSTPRARSSTPC